MGEIKENDGLELQRTTSIRREDVEKFLIAIQQIAKPFELNKRQRAIVDYDPGSPSVKIRYFTENEKETAECQGGSPAEKETLAFKNGRPCFIKA